MADLRQQDATRPMSVWIARGILATPFLAEVGVWVLASLPTIPTDWAVPVLLLMFAGIPATFGLAGAVLGGLQFRPYSVAAFAFVPVSLIFNLVVLFSTCTSNFQVAPF